MGQLTTLTADHAAFLAAIHADPSDTTARLVLADYLDERGDPDGELVRLLCEVQRPGPCVMCDGSGMVDGPSTIWMHAPDLDCKEHCPDCNGMGLLSAYQPGPAYARLEHLTGGLDAIIERLSERDYEAWLWEYLGGAHPSHLMQFDPATVAGWILSAIDQYASDPAAERRWQLCRAVEYMLGFLSKREGE